MLLLIPIPLAVAVVESSLTMLDAEELSPLSSAAQIVELEFTAVSMVKMLESNAQVVHDYMASLFTFCMDTFILHVCFNWFQFLQTALMARFV